MSGADTVSVIVLNRDRLQHLACTLKALTFQTRRDFELIIVSNQVARLKRDLALTQNAVLVDYHTANVSGARNAGIAAASGDIIAFCDDDAVPETTWLEQLTAGFARSDVGAVGGSVMGRNGVSLQWGFTEIDVSGDDHIRPEPSEQIVIRAPHARFAVKTAGTNCAFRRRALIELRGFDEAFAYYLDEADMNMRMNASDWATGFVKAARVYHGFAASARRLSTRVPVSLFEIGASKAAFCAKHGGRLGQFKQAQRKRMIGFMELGLLDPSDVAPLLAGLDAGVATGAQRDVEEPPIQEAQSAISSVYCAPELPKHVILRARMAVRSHGVWTRAFAAAKEGACVTLIDVRPSMRRLTMRFDKAGIWHHKFGQFGRLGRVERANPFRFSRSALQFEADRVVSFRYKNP